MSLVCNTSYNVVKLKAVPDSLVGQVLARPLFLKVKTKFHFKYFKTVDRKRYDEVKKLSSAHTCKIFHGSTKYSIVQKLSKQSAKVICRFDRLRTSYSKRQKSHISAYDKG